MSKPQAKGSRKPEKIQALTPPSQTRVSVPEIPAEWGDLSGMLGVDLDRLALETKALVRKREVRSAQDLLRMVLAYALWDWSFQLVGAWATVLGLWGVVISAVYMLRAYRSVFMGSMGESLGAVTDLRRSLRIPITLLVAMTIWFGFFPQTFVRLITPTFKTQFSKQ